MEFLQQPAADQALRNTERESSAANAAAVKAKRSLLFFQGNRCSILLQLIGVRRGKIDRRQVTM